MIATTNSHSLASGDSASRGLVARGMARPGTHCKQPLQWVPLSIGHGRGESRCPTSSGERWGKKWGCCRNATFVSGAGRCARARGNPDGGTSVFLVRPDRRAVSILQKTRCLSNDARHYVTKFLPAVSVRGASHVPIIPEHGAYGEKEGE